MKKKVIRRSKIRKQMLMPQCHYAKIYSCSYDDGVCKQFCYGLFNKDKKVFWSECQSCKAFMDNNVDDIKQSRGDNMV